MYVNIDDRAHRAKSSRSIIIIIIKFCRPNLVAVIVVVVVVVVAVHLHSFGSDCWLRRSEKRQTQRMTHQLVVGAKSQSSTEVTSRAAAEEEEEAASK